MERVRSTGVWVAFAPDWVMWRVFARVRLRLRSREVAWEDVSDEGSNLSE